MKKFVLFAITAVLAAALMYLIMTWGFGVEDPETVGLLIPIALVFVLFYVRGSGAKPQ